jgi:LPXTG-motif cell wall-anchored protein
MPPARNLAIVLSAAALSVPALALGQGAGGAGDDQYGDPLSGNGSTSTHTTTGSSSTTTTTTAASGLSQNPNLGTPTTPTTPTTPSTPSPSNGSLPKTGSDPRLLILAGLAMVLAGLGLRLRTADERF